MTKSQSRLILDTNLWVSFLISNRLAELQEQLFQSEIKLIFSVHLLSEIMEVLGRPYFQKRLDTTDFEMLKILMNRHGEVIRVHSQVNLCRDPKDNFLLALALDSKADYLVTGDKDLLVLKSVGSTQILTYSEWKVLNEE